MEQLEHESFHKDKIDFLKSFNISINKKQTY